MKIEEIMNDEFPVGMRVLVVDDDPYYLKKFEILLRKCGYQVTTADQANKALKLLRENKNEFDLVISDVKTRDMDAFDLLKVLALEMDLPVIMLSSHDDKELVMKGITHGACDYLLKPVRIEVLKIIWQHVVRKKSNSKEWENSQKPRGEFVEVQELKRTENVDHNNHPDKKRKCQDIEEPEDYNEKSQDQDDDPSTHKKARVVWTSELHDKFVAAVNTLGVDQAVPKRILEMMNDEKITRENVASHLQKYRQRLKKFSSVGSNERILGQVDNTRNVPGAWNTPYPAPWNSSSSSGLAVGSHFSESSGVPQWGQTDNLMNKTQHETNIRHSSTQNMGHRTPMPLQFDSREQNKDLTLVARNSAVHFDDTSDSTFNVNRSRKGVFSSNSAVFENRPSVSATSLNSDSSSMFPNSGGFIDNRPIANQSTRFYREQSRLVGTRDYRSNVGIMSPEISSFHPGSNAVPHTRTHSQFNMNHNPIYVHNILNQVVFNQSSHLHAASINPLMLHPDNTNLLCQSPGLQLNEDDLKILRDTDLGEMITEPLDNASDRLEAREANYEQ